MTTAQSSAANNPLQTIMNDIYSQIKTSLNFSNAEQLRQACKYTSECESLKESPSLNALLDLIYALNRLIPLSGDTFNSYLRIVLDFNGHSIITLLFIHNSSCVSPSYRIEQREKIGYDEDYNILDDMNKFKCHFKSSCFNIPASFPLTRLEIGFVVPPATNPSKSLSNADYFDFIFEQRPLQDQHEYVVLTQYTYKTGFSPEIKAHYSIDPAKTDVPDPALFKQFNEFCTRTRTVKMDYSAIFEILRRTFSREYHGMRHVAKENVTIRRFISGCTDQPSDDEFGGGAAKPSLVKVLGRNRKIHKVGRKQMVTYQGLLIPLVEAKKLERANNKIKQTNTKK